MRIPRATPPSHRWRPYSRNGYLLGSYRIATAPEPNSSRLTSFKSTCFDSPANNVGPWPASLGCTTNSYSSINPSSANASGSVTPPTNSPLPDSRLSCSTAFARSPRKSSAFQSTWLKRARHDVLLGRVDRAGEGFHPLGHPFGPQPICRPPPRGLHHFVSDPAKEQGIGLGEFLGPETMQFFVRGTCTMIDAAVQRDVDGIPKGSHYVRVPIAIGRPNLYLWVSRIYVVDKSRLAVISFDGYSKIQNR